MKRNPVTLALAAVALSACTMAPKATRPDFSAAQSWSVIEGYERPVGDTLATQMSWEEFFISPELRLVVDTALENNRDLKTAALSIREARALYRIDRAGLFPDIDATGGATLRRNTDESNAPNGSERTELYEANIGVTAYELDLFGKIRSGNEAALNDYLATREAHVVVRNALIAETVNAYLQLLADRKLLSLTEMTLQAQQHTHDILSQSVDKGVSTEQDLARAATSVETAQVNLHRYKRFVAQDENALFLLMGIPQQDGFLPETALDDIRLKEGIDPGLPSEVLLLRPDIRQAEYALLARNADIGAARAAFFPSISLTGAFGFASNSLGALFSGGAAGAWSFIPQVTLPIFRAGRNAANLDLAEIRKEKAVVAYEQAIQTAFREVADQLAARETLDEQLKAQRRLVAAARKVYDIGNIRYKSGIDSFLSVLDAQRELYTFQQDEIRIERQRLSNLVNLYKVLGGGAPPGAESAALSP